LQETIDGSGGNDILYGGDNNDTLKGGAGNDILSGDAGNDTMSGGAGNDTYSLQDAGDVITENSGEGTDSVLSYLSSYTLAANIENGRIMNTGAANLTGNSLGNALYAGTGNNVIDGGSGTDTVSYAYGATAGVTVSLAIATAQATGGSGSDTLIGIENLVGSSYADTLTGNSGNNTLTGGAGNDKMLGGAGNDTYYVDSAGDVITENSGEGTDSVLSYLSGYTLGANIENGRIMNTGAANLTGNNLNNVLYAGTGNNVINGGAGTDTVSYAYGATAGVTVSLAIAAAQATGGSGSDTLIGIENLIGSSYADKLTGNSGNNTLTGGAGNDTLIGGAGNDTLYGNDGNDSLDGGTGNDTMVGGTGDDTYVVDSASDVVTEAASAGTDRINAYVSDTLNANVENLYLYGTATIGYGNDLNNTIVGNSNANNLYGYAGNDILNGLAGNDTMVGGAGNDTYYVDSAGDAVTEAAGAGTDRVNAYVNYTLGSNVENLYLYGSTINGYGNPLGNTIVGNSNANNLYGYDGNDTLNGGSGADTMLGGSGNDIYYVDNSGDKVYETTTSTSTIDAGGVDSVYSYLAAYTLGSYVENGRIMNAGAANLTGNSLSNALYAGTGNNVINGGAGTDTASYAYGATAGVTVSLAIATAQATGGSGSDTLTGIENLVGSSYADALTGNSGNNILNGGTGNDTIAGGAGNDTYVVDSAGDVVTEAASAGTDRINAYANYTLSSNVENLYLYGTATTGTGNALDNKIYGSSNANTLYGLDGNDTLYGYDGDDTLNGGAGNDTMVGGTGNDTYYVDGAGDTVTEGLSAGTDTVIAYVNYTLGANQENLDMYVDSHTGTGNNLNNIIWGNESTTVCDTLYGLVGNDSLYGYEGNDTLNGGTGNDTLNGGLGQDRFVFAESGSANRDTIDYFSHTDDTIVLKDILDGVADSAIKGLYFDSGVLNTYWYFEGANITGNSSTDLSGIYVDTSTGNVYYNPTDNTNSGNSGDSVLICTVGSTAAASLGSADFIYSA
jgi:Ca2+-binding RTX toxin-like protein